MWKSRDPIPTFTTYLEHMSVLTPEKEQEIEQRIKDDARRCGAVCRRQPGSGAGRSRHRSLRVDPESWRRKFPTSKRFAKRSSKRCGAIRKCSCSARTSAPYGGAFGVTAGLCRGVRRGARASTRRSPSRRSSASASARRSAATGRSPRCSSPTSSRCGFDQIVNQAATLRYRYGGRATCPIVVRAPSGGNVGGGLYHSQNPEAWFIHRPGLKVVAPSTPWDAKGLLKAAIRDDNPVIYFEHKYLYRRAKGPVPEGDEIVPIGVAAIRREGSDATLVTYGAMVHAVARSGRSAGEGRRRGRSDRSAVADAVRQGGDLRVGREDQPRC